MAQNNSGIGKGNEGPGGGGGGPLTQSCTLYYQYGPGGEIPGFQNVNQLPPGTPSTYSTSQVILRVSPASGPSNSGDIMCSSYYTETQWQYIPGTSPATYKKGCCLAYWYTADNSGSDTTSGGGGIDTLPADLLFTCPTSEEITLSENGSSVLYNGEPLSQECCNRDVVGFDVTYINQYGGICLVLRQENTCPPSEAITVDTQNLVVIGIESVECCTSQIVGQSVYWDINTNSCRLSPIVIDNPNRGCTYTDIILEPLEQHNGLGTHQVFGTNSEGQIFSVTENCCNRDVTGYDVVWNPTLNICEKLSSTPEGSISITLNMEPISVSGCTDLIVSAKLFFTEPNEGCFTEGIVASLLPLDPNLVVEQLGVFDSTTDGFNNWVDLGIRIIGVNTNNFDIILNVSGGIVECCTYDIRLDNIRVDCFKEEDRIFFDNKKCIGFEIFRVIDNKKSWVYNPGTEEVGILPNDQYIRDRGEFTLLQGFGLINRTFAPSEDADIPWRYTDYYEQSNILEPHSNLVLNSKELELTFNMCASCCSNYSKCPEGYTLITTTGGTEYCTKTNVYCPSGYTLSAGTCYSGITSTTATTETLTGSTGLYCTKTFSLLELEQYKKVFQSFWVRMVEQFVPATTIFIAGERWCNNDTFICTEFEECDYDFEYVESEITVIEFETEFEPEGGLRPPNGGDVVPDLGTDTVLSETGGGEPFNSNDGPINTGGTYISPLPLEPGNPLVVSNKINTSFTGTKNSPSLDREKQTYFKTVVNGGVKIVFE